MNANELADKLLNGNHWEVLTEAATMLRQLQAEIEALKAENNTLQLKYDKLFIGKYV